MKTGRLRLVLFCALVIAIGGMSYAVKGVTASADDVEVEHMKAPTPTRLMIQAMGLQTSKILDSLMKGDFQAVEMGANTVAKSGNVILERFFPRGGGLGVWFQEPGKDPKELETVITKKKEIIKYFNTVVRASRNITINARKQDIMGTYRSFDDMMTNACIACHETFAEEWPEEWVPEDIPAEWLETY